MSPREAIDFVKRHGVVLQAARGPVPSLAETIAGGPIRGSWWGHAKGRTIFAATQADVMKKAEALSAEEAEQMLSTLFVVQPVKARRSPRYTTKGRR